MGSSTVPAASVCLYDPKRRELLIGRRLTGHHAGCWSFPGGRLVPGETPLDCARRELGEETGLDLPDEAPQAEKTVEVPAEEGQHPAYSVTCFIYFSDRQPVAETGELKGSWLPRGEAKPLPLAPGTETILDHLEGMLHETRDE